MAEQGGVDAAVPGWYPDPMRRHELRYWDGRTWTQHVANGDRRSIDALPNLTAPVRDTVQGATVAAGFWRRAGAYLIDVVPIMLLVGAVFYLFLGFDDTWAAYRAHPRHAGVRARFLMERNWIRDSAFLVWIVYCWLMEASPLQGTLGKTVLRLRVVGPDGGRLTPARAAARSLGKLLSYLPLGLGFLWAAFSKQKHAWHDMLAKTTVVHNEPHRGAIS